MGRFPVASRFLQAAPLATALGGLGLMGWVISDELSDSVDQVEFGLKLDLPCGAWNPQR